MAKKPEKTPQKADTNSRKSKLFARKKTKDASAPKSARKFHIIPGFLRNSWAELRKTTWPGRKETARLTVAVFVFSIIFGSFVAALDYGLDKIFKEVLLK